MQTGAMALFGEKYGDEVRVVSMGETVSDPEGLTPKRKANKAWSVELCGGTHVARTGDIGLIRVTAEAASAAGVRRIEALTAAGAREYLAQQDQRVRELAGALRTKPEDVVERVKALIEERKQMERDLANAKRALALSGGERRQRRGGESGRRRAHRRQGQADGARRAGSEPEGPARPDR